jgi:hypothetical protein
MKQFVLFVLALGLLGASACTKESPLSPVSNRASFTWTYAGNTFTADTVTAHNGSTTILSPGDTFTTIPEIYAQTGPWATPGTIFTAKLSSFSPTDYTDGGQNSFTENIVGVNSYSIAPFRITISSFTGGKISGTFTGELNSQSITGTFTNVAVH